MLATVFGREVITDLKDFSADADYKWTFPQKLGKNRSEIIAGVAIFTGLIPAAMLSTQTLMAIPFMIMAMFFLLKRKDYKTSKHFLDAGITMAILMLVI